MGEKTLAFFIFIFFKKKKTSKKSDSRSLSLSLCFEKGAEDEDLTKIQKERTFETKNDVGARFF